MRFGLKKFTSYDQALNYSLRLLQQRSYSEANLRQKLSQHQTENSISDVVIEKLKSLNLINDERYAQSLLRTESTYRHASSRRIAQKLYQKGIDRELIDTTLEQGDPDMPSEAERARYHAERWLAKNQSGDHLPHELRQKLAATLARRGFNYSIIRQISDQLLR